MGPPASEFRIHWEDRMKYEHFLDDDVPKLLPHPPDPNRATTTSSALPPGTSSQAPKPVKSTSTWHPTFAEAITHAKKLPGATVKPDGDGYRVSAKTRHTLDR